MATTLPWNLPAYLAWLWPRGRHGIMVVRRMVVVVVTMSSLDRAAAAAAAD